MGRLVKTVMATLGILIRWEVSPLLLENPWVLLFACHLQSMNSTTKQSQLKLVTIQPWPTESLNTTPGGWRSSTASLQRLTTRRVCPAVHATKREERRSIQHYAAVEY